MRKPGLKIFLTVLILFPVCCQEAKLPLPESKASEVGVSPQHLSRLDEVIEQAIDRKDLPGAVVLVARKGNIIWRKSYGDSQWVPRKKTLQASMVFDLASITKPVATATSIMILVEKGKLRLWDRVREFIPEFVPYYDPDGKPGEDARIWHLLTHTSGLPPYADVKEIREKYGDRVSTASLIDHIARLAKTDPPGKAFHYSCPGFITLAYVIEKVTGETISEFSAKNIFKPLKMKHTFFSTSDKFRNLCVPTEVSNGKPLQGVVHDPLARLQGGISGNAGLFSTADDLAIFAQMMLNRGRFNGVCILSPLSVERMTEVFPEAKFSGRGLGWDLDSSHATSGGDLFGPYSYGHTGYTGTSIWIDPETESFVILLTNRVHPADRGDVTRLRSQVSNIVASAIGRE